jgi:hypothetical protein
MPDLDLIKQGEQGVRDRCGWFARGRSGNPAGRPRSCRDRVSRAARLLLAGERQLDGIAGQRLAFAEEAAATPVAISVGAIPDTAESQRDEENSAPRASAGRRRDDRKHRFLFVHDCTLGSPGWAPPSPALRERGFA